MIPRTSPESERELLERPEHLAGRTFGEIAMDLKTRLPSDLKRAKGWIGELTERALGASASSLPEPDFPRFGIELKTIPVDRAGRPRESTYVTAVPLVDNVGLTWASRWCGGSWRGCFGCRWTRSLGDRACRSAHRITALRAALIQAACRNLHRGHRLRSGASKGDRPIFQ